MKVTIYTDGSSRGNPGPGGYGAVLQFVDSTGKLHERELSQGYATTTNNRMELLGVIVALEALKRPCTVEVHSDSQYVVNAFNQHWVDGWLKRGWKNAKKEPAMRLRPPQPTEKTFSRIPALPVSAGRRSSRAAGPGLRARGTGAHRAP